MDALATIRGLGAVLEGPSVRMTSKKASGDAFPYALIARRIAEMQDLMGLSFREFATLSGMKSHGSLSRKYGGISDHFSVADINRIVAVVRGKTGEPLTCWPFVSLESARKLDRIVDTFGGLD